MLPRLCYFKDAFPLRSFYLLFFSSFEIDHYILERPN